MKHKNSKRTLALVLTLCLTMSLAMPTSAAGWGKSGSSGLGWWQSIWDGISSITGSSKPSGGSSSTGSSSSTGDGMTLVEDETTVENGDMLRASTYALTSGTSTYAAGDYNQVTMTYAELSNSYESTTYYYLSGGTYYKITDVSYSNNRYFVYSDDYSSYFALTNGRSSSSITVYTLESGSTTTSTIKYFPVTMYNYDQDTINEATYKADGGTETGIYFNDGNPSDDASNKHTGASASVSPWNYWVGHKIDSTGNGNRAYTGLVQSTLDIDKNIVFTKAEGGIFNSDTTVKSIYTNVEMPFVYENGTYTFDSSANGVYFHADSTQNSTTAQSNGRLYFNQGKTQSNGTNYGDGSKTMWMPFNDATSISGESNCDYYFGMRTTIPFTMTANGRMNANDDTSEAITFSFSGDDDVWVFIDGQLVLDLGGIHNRIDASINFATNTWTLSKDTTANPSRGAVANVDGSAISGHVFAESGVTDARINQTRTTFAASDSHELTIFYLERGAGSSNCKIQFNLPMKDTVTVQKRIEGTATVDSLGEISTDNLDKLTDAQKAVLNNLDFGFTLYKDGTPVSNTTYNLLNENGQVISTPSTDNNGHFTLKNGQTAKFIGSFTDAGNEYYVVEDIKDGFIYTDYDVSSNTAKTNVIDLNQSYSYAKTHDAYYITDMDAGPLKSGAYTVSGSDESEDSLSFVCKNYMNATLPRPSAIPSDDKVVIDYGLSVEINISRNDYYLGDEDPTVTFPDYSDNGDGSYTADFGTFTYSDGVITYQLNKQLTGVEVISYTLTSSAKADDGTTVSASGTAKVYIIPATSMYYEEDFGFIKTSGSWTAEGDPETEPQEPGVVGTVGDSPYGSDAAYLNDSRDSNGSSLAADTNNAQALFAYRFTGTGTTIYGRTSADTGYLRIRIYEVVDGVRSPEYTQFYRDTMRLPESEGADVLTLYNVPIFTETGLDYGTYEVQVAVYKKGTPTGVSGGAGSEFYLDGIRVYEPLDSTDGNYSVATAAYSSDAEANCTVATISAKILNDYTTDGEDGLVWVDESHPFITYTDTNGKIVSADEFSKIAPKDEVYLAPGQSIQFSLAGWDADDFRVYLGMKSPTGSGASVKVGSTQIALNNAADCYFDISKLGDITTVNGVDVVTFTITSTADEGEIVALTNIKVTGISQFVIVSGDDQTV